MPGLNVRALQEARRAPRFPTCFQAEALFGRRRAALRVCDISRVGACVRGPGLPEKGAEIVLRARGLDVVATVVWCREDACGLDFHRSVEPLEIVRQNAPGMERFRGMTAARAMPPGC